MSSPTIVAHCVKSVPSATPDFQSRSSMRLVSTSPSNCGSVAVLFLTSTTFLFFITPVLKERYKSIARSRFAINLSLS